MRIRTIKPEFFKHDELAELPPLIRLLFVGLWCVADCAGRLQDRPARIKAEVLPYDKCDVVAAIELLTQKGFISRYQVGTVNLIQINNFRKHQRITGKEAETPSKFPAQFPSNDSDTVLDSDERSGKPLGNIGETPETTGREGKGKEGKGMDGKHPPQASPAQSVEQPASPSPSTKSKPSSLIEAVSYFTDTLGSTADQGEAFFDHFEANGWKQGGKATIKDWRAAARSWHRRSANGPRGVAAGLGSGEAGYKKSFAGGGRGGAEEFVKLPIVGIDIGADEVAALEAGKGGAS